MAIVGATSRKAVDLVDEQDAGPVAPSLGEHAADRLGHVAEVAFTARLPIAVARGDEVHPGGLRQRLCECGLACARRAGDQQSAIDGRTRAVAPAL